MRRALAAAVVCMIHGCAARAPRPVDPTKPAPPVASASASASNQAVVAAKPEVGEAEDAKLIAKMLRKIAKVRGLTSKKTVPGVALARKDLIAKITDKVKREIPAEAIRREGDWLKLYGFIPAGMDYLDTTMKLLEAQLAGFYEPKDGTMYLAEDLDPLNSDATLSHELVHALQDQYWDLRSRSQYKPGDSDGQSAISALAEGDATSAMMDLMVQRFGGRTALDLDDDDLGEQIMAGMNTGPSANAPHIMRTSLASAYIEGTKFVHSVRRQRGWKGVDAVWARPPTTTEQILHPEKWASNERGIPVAIPSGAALGSTFKKDNDDVSGELGLGLAFDEWAEGSGRAAALGWGGDRDALYVDGPRIAGILRVQYDAEPAGGAARAFKILSEAWPKAIGAISRKEPAFVCVERKELGPIAIAWRRSDLVIAAGPTRVEPTWASASTCAEAKRWIEDVLK